MAIRIVTIGVYGWSEKAFFDALVAANIDLFCDVRSRRGMRGSAYAFANATRLQQALQDLGIRYTYFRELAPSGETRAAQHQDDKLRGVKKRSRETLGRTFIASYSRERLSVLDVDAFIRRLGSGTRAAALFCVEREPSACHRSLLAKKLSESLAVEVSHLMP